MTFLKVTIWFLVLLILPLQGQINPTVSSSTGNFSLTCTNPTIILTASSSFTAPVSYTWTTPQLTVVNGNTTSTSSSGTFSLTASSGTLLQTVTLAIQSNTVQPTVTLTPSSATITCTTPTILMTAIGSSNNFSYTWIEPSIGFGCASATCIAYTSGVYGVTVKDLSNGCQKTSTLNILDGRDYPNISAPANIFTVACPGGTVILTPQITGNASTFTYSWSSPGGAIVSGNNTQSLVTNYPGNYIVTVTNTLNGCATMAQFTVFACVDLEDFDLTSTFQFYPNPTKGALVLVITDTQYQIKNISVSNTMGDIMYKNTELTDVIDVSYLTSGIYFLRIETTRGAKTLKFIKE